MTAEIILKDIATYITQCGGNLAGWYIGIAADPQTRLFQDHRVDQASDPWIFREAPTSDLARQIERYMLERGGLRGGPGGGDFNSKFVYAYRINSHTLE